APIPSEFFKLNAAHYGSQHNNRFRICYAELTLTKAESTSRIRPVFSYAEFLLLKYSSYWRFMM
uniref:hypothetical protein n=1 Tax=Leptospira noguchii TaxID=28182 RepID=UPI0009E4CF7C